MPKKLSRKELQQRVKKIKMYYPQLTIDLSTYINCDKKIRTIDKDYGEWWTSFKNLFLKKTKHPKRRIAEQIKRQTTELNVVKDKIYKKWKDLVTIYEDSYKNCITNAKFNHKIYGDFILKPERVINGHLPRKFAAKKSGEQHRKYNIKYISKKLKKIYGDQVMLDEDKFIYNKKAWFIHKKYGSWYADIGNVLKGHTHPLAAEQKRKKNSLKKYGVEYPPQNIEIQKKIMKSNGQTMILHHWKNNNEIIVRASYEWAVVTYLNNKKIDFDWQIPFNLNINGEHRLYICDLYLPCVNKYIEIKGCFKSDMNKLKWETFHNKYKNSEIWFAKEVEKFVGKSRYIFLKEYKKERQKYERENTL